MPLIKPRTRGKQLVRRMVTLDRETNETLFAYVHFLGESTDYVFNEVGQYRPARDKEFQAWRAEHTASFVPPSSASQPVEASEQTPCRTAAVRGRRCARRKGTSRQPDDPRTTSAGRDADRDGCGHGGCPHQSGRSRRREPARSSSCGIPPHSWCSFTGNRGYGSRRRSLPRRSLGRWRPSWRTADRRAPTTALPAYVSPEAAIGTDARSRG